MGRLCHLFIGRVETRKVLLCFSAFFLDFGCCFEPHGHVSRPCVVKEGTGFTWIGTMAMYLIVCAYYLVIHRLGTWVCI